MLLLGAVSECYNGQDAQGLRRPCTEGSRAPRTPLITSRKRPQIHVRPSLLRHDFHSKPELNFVEDVGVAFERSAKRALSHPVLHVVTLMENMQNLRSSNRVVWRIALSTTSGDHTREAPCFRAKRRVGTVHKPSQRCVK